jgi:hypothetical protein
VDFREKPDDPGLVAMTLLLTRTLESTLGGLQRHPGAPGQELTVEPFRSAKRTVTCLRSPSRAAFEFMIRSARCLGV